MVPGDGATTRRGEIFHTEIEFQGREEKGVAEYFCETRTKTVIEIISSNILPEFHTGV